MASIKGIGPAKVLDGSALRIAIVHARWNEKVIEGLVNGAVTKLKERGVKDSNIVIESVPGSFELPLACSRYIFQIIMLFVISHYMHRMIAGSHVQTGSNVTDLLGSLNFSGSF